VKVFSSIPPEKPDSEILNSIDKPSDLRKLQVQDLPKVSDELREYLLYTVGQTGGHFGAGLGVIELTVALHFVFNTPSDRLVWDVGHQSYPHKILTGRKDSMESIRQMNGLAPFPSRFESEYDAFGVGHSSTSISAALGMITASNAKNEDKHVTAIIGDGALTAGMAFEALAHAGSMDENLLVILNDNQMSISENVGGLRNYLSRIWASRTYNKIRDGGKTVLTFVPAARAFVRKAEIHAKGMVAPGALFEELGFEYIGPVDGHDVVALTKILQDIKRLKGPRFLHIKTTKGKGFAPAEKDQIGFHAINKIKRKDSAQESKNTELSTPSYSEVFGEWLCYKAKQDERLMAITPAMREGSGMVQFSKDFPDRYFDVAIAEQHSVTFAAGLACEGLKPVVAIYSTFLQRAYDQLIHDVALQNLDVLFAVDRAGLIGADGATHQGTLDLSFLRCVPNMVIMTPSNEDVAWKMLNTGFKHEGPVAVRYPRGKGSGKVISKDDALMELGKSTEIRNTSNKEVAILSFGNCLGTGLEVADELNAALVDMNFVKPIDEEKIKQISQEYKLVVTLEENVVKGGAGSAVSEIVSQSNSSCSLLLIGLPDEFIDHGDQTQQKVLTGLNKEAVLDSIKDRLSNI
jgi:1-deoxy-D-xylulose-5-phosphate synthase